MKNKSLILILALLVLAMTGCGKNSGLEGKVVDGQGKPLTGVKLIAKQVESIKGYEQFEAITSSDGTFRFKKLFPTSEYILIPWFDDWSLSPQRTLSYEENDLTARFNQDGWVTKDRMKVNSAPEGHTVMLKSPIKIKQTISTIAGKVVDGQGKPLAGIKIIAKQEQPIKGYEQFETVTTPDGNFHFKKLFPHSKYSFFPISELWKTDVKKVFISPGEQETLKGELTIRFTLANGVVTDSATELMWAAQDNDKNIDWINAKAYCEHYEGGGFSDWRLPTFDELKKLYQAGIRSTEYENEDIIKISAYHTVWSSETSDEKAMGMGNVWRGRFYKAAAGLNFDPRRGSRKWDDLKAKYRHSVKTDHITRALPVRKISSPADKNSQRLPIVN